MTTSPIPVTLRTARLLLRPWTAVDAVALHPILVANVAHLTRWIPQHVATPVPIPELQVRLAGFAEDFIAGRAFRFAVVNPDTSRVLGEADLFPRSAAGRVPLADADHVEVGYWLDAAATGQGLATEAVSALIDVAATVPGMRHVEIHCDSANAPSAAIPKRLGFALSDVEGEMQVWRKAIDRHTASSST